MVRQRVEPLAVHLGLQTQIVDALAGPPQFLHVTGVTMALGDGPAGAVGIGIRQARQRGVKICLDVNHRGRLWSIHRARELLGGLVDSLDVVVASDDELALLAPGAGVEEQARWLLERGVTEVVVKLRAAGRWPTPVRRSFAVRPGRRRGRLRSRISLRRAGRPSGPGTAGKANAVGTFVVGTRGEWEGLPTRRELSMLDRGQGEVVR